MQIRRILIGTVVLSLFGCSSATKNVNRTPSSVGGFAYDERRGSPSEYDPGAPKDSKWLELFGRVPNYRAVGSKIIGGDDEKFRWQFGPMWYRGRLGKSQVKVFVVGQEGAQDENISNRAFTGSTGTRTQKFLNHLGIYNSYVFMNTFVYTINGQLEPDNKAFKWMEQGETSPIVSYRHELFDYMMEMNADTVSLFMGVGSGGKASLATWVESRGGSCSVAQEMKYCNTKGMKEWFYKNKGIKIKNEIFVIGVPHPGGANPNLGGDEAMENIKRGFSEASQRVYAFKKQNPSWLNPDPEESDFGKKYGAYPERLSSYEYKGYAPIPFKDFAFGTNWRMGDKGTTSNRWGTDSIQVFSDDGEYNNKDSVYSNPSDKDSGFSVANQLLTGMHPKDVAYEPPRFYTENNYSDHAAQFDYGPCGLVTPNEASCDLSNALNDWPDFSVLAQAPVSHSTFGHGPSYRGRLKSAEILILADQESHDDFFSGRALTGTVGQMLQSWLKVTNVGSNYAVIRTLPVDTLGLTEPQIKSLALSAEVSESRQKIMDLILSEGKTKVIVSLGAIAKVAIENLKLPQDVLRIDLSSAAAVSHITSWNAAAVKAAGQIGKTVNGKYEGKLSTIPREDLPYHSRWWMGSSGTRSSRGDGVVNGSYYRLWAPRWVKNLKQKPLEKSEIAEIEKAMAAEGL